MQNEPYNQQGVVEQEEAPRKRSWVSMLIIVVIAIAAIAGAAMFFSQKAGWSMFGNDSPDAAAAADVEDLLAKVGKLMVLPANETPTVATVTDPDRLKNQAFFANAEKGDRVLIYTTARKAILYSPRLGKVVEVAPLVFDANAQGTTQ